MGVLCRDVIHTVGPVARGHVGPTETNDLTSCYQNSLRLMKEHGLSTVHPPIPLCLCLLLWAAKSVMVTALPCSSVRVERSSGPFDTHALASRVLGRYSVLHPGSPHLSSGP
ncbi:O-acetyl-ADP-ribose deacetylase MACROD2 [Collichthys lucidus]|uniref:O-acetyl-ADP-ribose deacetylase MACROD2 n=1 Tax=Collichthys lucidus TaxID=240159 RepID=A0A4U5VCR9_COLLU|nr:O-acetyl-ADP-ribose deacetylase MACROD2 [Collichthys lucidus]